MARKLKLTAEDILQKEFNNKMRGYDPVEVDEFLDDIIKDYGTYSEEIKSLTEENRRLQAQIEKLKRDQEVYSKTQPSAPKQTQTVTNFDILKRLSNLEQKVFGDKLD